MYSEFVGLGGREAGGVRSFPRGEVRGGARGGVQGERWSARWSGILLCGSELSGEAGRLRSAVEDCGLGVEG